VYEIGLDGVVLKATRPKDLVLGRAAGIFDDKYASTSQLARTAFEFLEATFDDDSWRHVLGRLQDKDDHFDTDDMANVFEALFDAIVADNPDKPAPNRAARRAPAR
jgi:hypothetical protein